MRILKLGETDVLNFTKKLEKKVVFFQHFCDIGHQNSNGGKMKY